MHDNEHTRLEREIAAGSPHEPDAAALAGVEARARTLAARPQSARSWMRGSVATAVAVVAVTAVALTIAGRGPHLTIAFAEEDALAALKPAVGQVVHIKARTFAQNHGDAEPVEDGSVYEESWIDFENNVQRAQSRAHSTDELIGDSVFSEGRLRYVADDPETPESVVYVSEMYAPGSVGGLTFWAYSYLPDRMDEGEVVGEVTHNGELCWDVRWTDSQDTAGNKMNARALFRQPDYRPLLVERDYPGGAVERWEVMAWSNVDRGEVPSGTFDPATIGAPEMPERQAWYADALAAHVDYPVFWSGDNIGEREIIGDVAEPTPGDVVKKPFFINYLRFDTAPQEYSPADTIYGGDRTTAEYWPTSGDAVRVTISSGARIEDEELPGAIERGWSVAPSSERESALGTALIAELDGGAFVAAVQTPEATVIIEAPDSRSMDGALKQLGRVE